MKVIELSQLDPKQVEAINACLDPKRRAVAVTGPAGSGKTTIIRFAYEKLTEAGYSVALAAPTGKAAKRIREATGLPAITFHLLLQFTAPMDIDPKTGKPYGDTFPRCDRENPLVYDVIIGDEYAMINRELHTQIVAAIKPGGRLLTFGDVQQLPPIETLPKYQKQQTAFEMLLEKCDGIKLATVHRQEDGSDVLFNAKRILSGIMPQNREAFKLVGGTALVDDLLREIQRHDYTSLENQVITPANISWIGSHKLNTALQATLWASEDRKMYKPMRWKNKATGKGAPEIELGVGDKVIITRNTYNVECSDGTLGLFNGETGIITEISDLEEIVIDFGDRVARVPYAMQGEYNGNVFVNYPHRDIDLAYAVTTHKCQGSEFKNVIYVIGRSVFRMLNRRNLYTAVTRARETVTIVYDKDALIRSVTQKEPMA